MAGEEALACWRLLNDCTLWAMAEDRAGLFSDAGARPDLLPDMLRGLARVYAIETTPTELAEAAAVAARACEAMARPEAALQFAELAARLDPDRADLASVAGRLCRVRREIARGTIWFQRAVRTARRLNREIDFANAHLGWGNLEADSGRLDRAEHHATRAFRAALRVGKRSLAASAYHDLMAIRIHQQRLPEAWAHARDALAVYKVDDPRFAALAHDIAFLWSREGYYSCALLVFEGVLPTMAVENERLVVLGNIVRAAAACRDKFRYERAVRELLAVIDSGREVPVSAVYHAACGCISYEDWDRGTRLSRLTAELAPSRWQAMARQLVHAVDDRLPGDVDILPEEKSEIDRVRDLLLRRLRKHVASLAGTPGKPDARYPIM